MTAGFISALGTKCCGFWCSALNLIFPQIFFVIGASHVALVVNNLPANAGDIRDTTLIPWFRKIPWRTAWQPTPVFLPGESHGQRGLVGYSPRGRAELDVIQAT